MNTRSSDDPDPLLDLQSSRPLPLWIRNLRDGETSMNMLVRDYAASSVNDFLLEASFWRPEHMMQSAWLGHAPFAYWLTSVLKPRSIVELGVHTGFSFLTFCQAIRALQLRCTCAGVDTWQGDEHAGFYGNEVYERLSASNGRNARFSRLIRSTFDEARSEFADGSIDLLHIDGRHHYDDVREDFETWRPKLSSRAIVLFHDIDVPEYGVGKLWDELCNEYPHFAFHHSHGLGVLSYGDDIPVKLQQLFLSSDVPSMSDSIRDAYERLGNAISDQQRIADLEQQIHDMTMSTSWRITRPLRAMSKCLTSLRKMIKRAKA